MSFDRSKCRTLADWRERSPEVKALWAARQAVNDLGLDASEEKRELAKFRLNTAYREARQAYRLFVITYGTDRYSSGKCDPLSQMIESLQGQFTSLRRMLDERMDLTLDFPTAHDVLGLSPFEPHCPLPPHGVTGDFDRLLAAGPCEQSPDTGHPFDAIHAFLARPNGPSIIVTLLRGALASLDAFKAAIQVQTGRRFLFDATAWEEAKAKATDASNWNLYEAKTASFMRRSGRPVGDGQCVLCEYQRHIDSRDFVEACQ